MKRMGEQPYEQLIEEIRAASELRPGSDQLANRRWYEQTFCLCVLGDALAASKGWSLAGMDAIEYAIIDRYSWSPQNVREMDPRDKWLSLHEQLAVLTMDPKAVSAWFQIEQAKIDAIGSPDDVWRPYPRGFPLS